MDNLVELYTEDRNVTKAMVEATFIRDNVPTDLITAYFDCYDQETELGLKIAQWLDDNRAVKGTEEATEDAN